MASFLFKFIYFSSFPNHLWPQLEEPTFTRFVPFRLVSTSVPWDLRLQFSFSHNHNTNKRLWERKTSPLITKFTRKAAPDDANYEKTDEIRIRTDGKDTQKRSEEIREGQQLGKNQHKNPQHHTNLFLGCSALDVCWRTTEWKSGNFWMRKSALVGCGGVVMSSGDLGGEFCGENVHCSRNLLKFQ